MKTQVFAHKGYVGILSATDAEGLLTDPTQPGQLGFIADAAFVEIQAEALELLKQINRSGDDIGDVDVFSSGDKVIFGWLGGPLKAFKPEEIEGSSTYDASLLTATEGVETDKDFADFIDTL